MSTYFNGPPGVGVPRTASYRTIFLQRSESFLAQGRLISGQCSRDPGNADVSTLRAGLLMGKIATVVNSLGVVGAYAPSIMGLTTNAEAVGSTSIEASAAVVTELVRRCGASGTFKLTGPAVAGGAVQTETVTYSAASGTAITCTGILNGYVAGSFIQPTDGSEVPLSFIPDADGYGIYVLDDSQNSLSVVDFPRLPVSGVVDVSEFLPGWPTDTGLRQWLMNRLNDVFGGQFVFAGSGGSY